MLCYEGVVKHKNIGGCIKADGHNEIRHRLQFSVAPLFRWMPQSMFVTAK